MEKEWSDEAIEKELYESEPRIGNFHVSYQYGYVKGWNRAAKWFRDTKALPLLEENKKLKEEIENANNTIDNLTVMANAEKSMNDSLLNQLHSRIDEDKFIKDGKENIRKLCESINHIRKERIDELVKIQTEAVQRIADILKRKK